MFSALLPNRLPTARPIWPILAAAMDVDSSGREVVSPRRAVPTNVVPIPVSAAIRSADAARIGAATAITSTATPNAICHTAAGSRVTSGVAPGAASGREAPRSSASRNSSAVSNR